MNQSLQEKPIQTQPTKVTPGKKNSARAQEKMMGILTIGFIGGIILYATLPAGQIRGIAIGGFGVLMTYLLFKFGI